jgi:hypothetical protein
MKFFLDKKEAKDYNYMLGRLLVLKGGEGGHT